MSTKLSDARLQKITLALGCIVFLGTLIWIATSPVSIAVWSFGPGPEVYCISSGVG